MNILHEKHWASLDIEFIQTTKNHKCFRKLYILAKDGFTDWELEFYPCKKFKDLDKRYKKSFCYCRANIHLLSCSTVLPCSIAVTKIGKFIKDNGIDLILYKGGCIEKQICKELGISSFNIEKLGKFEKPYSHDPYVEVDTYYEQLIQL